MRATSRTIRLFVSSTFSDMKSERDLLQREVFPRLREFCLNRGLRFQAIDLRWGVSEEASRDNRAMRICLRELRRCQSGGPKPNFLILLGDRYGARPLPEVVPAELFKKLQQQVDAETIPIAGLGTAELLRTCYRRDDNAVPPAYFLQPRQPPFDDPKRWTAEIEIPLLAALQRAARSAGVEAEVSSLGLGLSATHLEILNGALNLPAGEVRQHVHVFSRNINFPARQPPSSHFIDLLADGSHDTDAQSRLRDLRSQITAHISPDNLHKYAVDWRNEGKFTDADLKPFQDDVLGTLQFVIAEQVKAMVSISPAKQEEAAHRSFGAERRTGFVGREAELKRVTSYLAGTANRPLLVLGPAGSGKSAFMAEITLRARQDHPAALLIERYIGATPAASRVVSVLHDLVQRIRAAHLGAASTDSDVKSSPDDDIPSAFNPLVAAFHEALKRVTSEKPLILFLDALDQFSGTDIDSINAWLPTTLPAGVRIVVSSALPSNLADGSSRPASHLQPPTPQVRVYTILAGRLPADTHLLLPPLQQDHGAQMLDHWLAVAGRTLQPEQRAAVLGTFALEGNPLWLRTAAEEASRLASWAPTPDLPATTADLLRRLLARLAGEHEHGAVLVERALVYLACSRHGLSEDEMLDLLSDDDAVMENFHRRFPKSPNVSALPVAIWVPLLGDIAPYLGEHEAHGASLLRFYHRVLQETVETSFLTETGKCQRAHRTMAVYFTEHARGPDAARFWESTNTRGFAECIFHQAGSESWKDVEPTLSDFGFLMQKTRLGLLEGVFDDWMIVDAQAPVDTRLHLAVSRAFFREKAHILRRGNAEWPAYKILLQLAAEHAFDSPLTFGAKHWLADSRCDWTWLCRNQRLSRAQVSPCAAVFEGHSNSVMGALALPDGRLLSWSEDKTLRVWDGQSGAALAVLEGHTGSVMGALALLDGRLLSWSKDKTLRVWNGQSGALLAVLKGHTDSVTGALALPGGRVLSWSEDKTLRVWDDQSGAALAVLSGHTKWVMGAQMFPNGRLFSWSIENLRLWDGRSGTALAEFKGHTNWIRGALALPNGRLLSWSWDRTLRLWDGQSGNFLAFFSRDLSPVRGALALPVGRLVTWSEDKTLRLWCYYSGAVLAVFNGHSGSIRGALAVPEGRLLTWSEDKTLRLWNRKSGATLAILQGHSNAVMGALALPDGRLVSWSEDKALRMWDGQSGAALGTLEGHSGSVGGALALDDGRLVSWSDDTTLRLWDGRSSAALAGHEGHTNTVKDVLTLPDGRLVSWSKERTLRLWDTQNGAMATLEGHSGSVVGTMVLDDGRLLSWSDDGTLRLWDRRSGAALATLAGHSASVIGVRALSDGRLVSWSQDKTLRLWDGQTGAAGATFRGHIDSVIGVRVLPDGRMVSWSKDRTLRLWDAQSGAPLTVLEGHSMAVVGAILLADGRLLSWSDDGTLRLWDGQGKATRFGVMATEDGTLRHCDGRSGNALAILKGHSKAVSGARVLAGGRLLSWSEDMTLRLWNSRDGAAQSTLRGHFGPVTGAIALDDGRLLSWAEDETIRLWGKTGSTVAVHSINEGLRLFPEFGAVYRMKDQHQSRCHWSARSNCGRLRVSGQSDTGDISWHGDSGCRAHQLRPNGRAILTQQNGQVCFLQLQHGNRPISIEEFEALRPKPRADLESIHGLAPEIRGYL